MSLFVRLFPFGAAVSVLALSSAASAAPPQKSNVSGSTASLGSSRDEAITCVDGLPGTLSTSINISGTENVTRDGGRPNGVRVLDVQVFQFETCTFSFHAFAGFIDGAAFTGGRAPTLRGSVQLFEQGNGAELFGKVDVDLAWTATENPTKTSLNHRDTFGNVTTVTRSSGSFASATTTGTAKLFKFTGVVNGSTPVFETQATDLLASPTFSFAQIGTNTTGTTTFIKHTRADAR